LGTAASPHQETVCTIAGKLVGETADLLIKFNAWLRDKTPLNFGNLLFYPIHRRAWAAGFVISSVADPR